MKKREDLFHANQADANKMKKINEKKQESSSSNAIKFRKPVKSPADFFKFPTEQHQEMHFSE